MPARGQQAEWLLKTASLVGEGLKPCEMTEPVLPSVRSFRGCEHFQILTPSWPPGGQTQGCFLAPLTGFGPALDPLKLTTSWCSASLHSSPARACWSPCWELFLCSPSESWHPLGPSSPPFILYPPPPPEWSPSPLVILTTNWMLMMPDSPPCPPSPSSR